MVVSDAVIDECSDGDPDAARRRLEFIDGIESYPLTAEIRQLAEIYRALLGIPKRALVDCIHLAVCVIHKIDALLTWNCAHLGLVAQMKVKDYNEKNGLWTPILVTPDTIVEVQED